jgi:hypothetical protein
MGCGIKLIAYFFLFFFQKLGQYWFSVMLNNSIVKVLPVLGPVSFPLFLTGIDFHCNWRSDIGSGLKHDIGLESVHESYCFIIIFFVFLSLETLWTLIFFLCHSVKKMLPNLW